MVCGAASRGVAWRWQMFRYSRTRSWSSFSSGYCRSTDSSRSARLLIVVPLQRFEAPLVERDRLEVGGRRWGCGGMRDGGRALAATSRLLGGATGEAGSDGAFVDFGPAAAAWP